MSWKLSVGNLISRAPASPAASGSTEDADYPLSDLGNGHPNDPSRWQWESDGVYAATFDLNLLSTASARIDAPTGWADLALAIAGTPGLGPNPPDRGTYDTRANTLRLFRPVYQDIEVMPGEDLLIQGGIRVDTASDATGVRVIAIDLATGKQWDGVLHAFNDSTDPVAAQTTLDAWLDFSETIVNTSDERTTYRVILAPDGGVGATFYVYANDISVTASQDFVALVGHNIPVGSSVTWTDGTVTATFSPIELYSMFETFTASKKRNWTLTITMPANTKAWTQRPYIGELWAGRQFDMLACPSYPFDILEGDLDQVRLLGGGGREDVSSSGGRPNRIFTMKFKVSNAASYEDARDGFMRACRHGADPVILMPVNAVENADVIWHGRVANEVTYSLTGRARRTFEIKLRESPFPRFR